MHLKGFTREEATVDTQVGHSATLRDATVNAVQVSSMRLVRQHHVSQSDALACCQ